MNLRMGLPRPAPGEKNPAEERFLRRTLRRAYIELILL
jgi:hypothetical protein